MSEHRESRGSWLRSCYTVLKRTHTYCHPRLFAFFSKRCILPDSNWDLFKEITHYLLGSVFFFQMYLMVIIISQPLNGRKEQRSASTVSLAVTWFSDFWFQVTGPWLEHRPTLFVQGLQSSMGMDSLSWTFSGTLSFKTSLQQYHVLKLI